MNTYVIILKDRQSGTLSKELLMEHVEHLRDLSKSEKLIFCGPYTDRKEAIKIIRASDSVEAEEIATSDPFTRDRYYRSYTINQVTEANLENNFLMT